MIIQKKRITKIDPYIIHVKDDSGIVFGIADPTRFSDILNNIGFVPPYEIGKSILPSGIGSVSVYNSEGKMIKHKDQPKETAYRQTIWNWKQWDGSWHSKIVDVPYKRYPRSFLPPPAIEITLTKSPAGNLLLTSSVFKKTKINYEILKHTINLFLELFKECELFSEDLDSIITTQVRRLNWIVLPQGEMPWGQYKKEVAPIVNSAPKGNQSVLYYRLETINNLKPDFRAIGSGGFHGYIVHGFTKLNIYILESMYYGNASYVFGETWEELSMRTKAEILNENLQKARIIHRRGWKNNIEKIVEGGENKRLH